MTEKYVESAAEALVELRRQRPLVHNITNYVVMDFSANALLAIGASPVMAHAAEEVREMVGLAGALVLNIGTLSSPWIEAMFAAGQAARARHLPVVLDPVGAGATRLRTETALRLVDEVKPGIIRGNASEILSLAAVGGATKGVDSTRGVDEARDTAIAIARRTGALVAVTGAEDFVTDGERRVRVANGHPLMAKVTGTGCVCSALVGAFAAVRDDPLVATVTTLVIYGIAGELAAVGTPGPGSFRTRLIDALDAITPAEIQARARVTSE
jgi:hydroxyethylthiazole kinase